MATHTPFLREYIFGNNDAENIKNDIRNIKYQLKQLNSYKDEFNKKLQEAIASLPYPDSLKVTVHNDEVKKVKLSEGEIMIITGDSLINMIQQIANDLSDVTERVRRLETKWDIKNVL